MTISPDLAFVDGVKLQRVKLLLMLVTGINDCVANEIVGAPIITSPLIIPAATARRLPVRQSRWPVSLFLSG